MILIACSDYVDDVSVIFLRKHLRDVALEPKNF